MQQVGSYVIPESLVWDPSVMIFNEGRDNWCITMHNDCHQLYCDRCLCCSDRGEHVTTRLMTFAALAQERGYTIKREGFTMFNTPPLNVSEKVVVMED